jgi:hypothetical protein
LIDQLRKNTSHAEWLAHLEGLDGPDLSCGLPSDDEMTEILSRLEVPPEDIATIIATRPDRPWNPEIRWLFERSLRSLKRLIGSVEVPRWFPSPLEVEGMDPYFFVHVFVATLPDTLAYHRSRGIPEVASWAILADLGRNVRVNRKRYGTGGLEVSHWLMLHFRGSIYQLGRLQFERSMMHNRFARGLAAHGVVRSPDDLVLSLHIPDFLGPLSPEACDASIEMAKTFYAVHFPEDRYEYAVCHSWLLDPQLKGYLAPTSNFIRFQERFELAEVTGDADRSIVQFVFGPVPDDYGDLPRRSSLERAVADHLAAGGHWRSRSGWFRLD